MFILHIEALNYVLYGKHESNEDQSIMSNVWICRWESKMEYFNALRRRYKLPDLTKLWNQDQDQVIIAMILLSNYLLNLLIRWTRRRSRKESWRSLKLISWNCKWVLTIQISYLRHQNIYFNNISLPWNRNWVFSITLQEISLWLDPKTSLLALIVYHLGFELSSFLLGSTAIYALATTSLIGNIAFIPQILSFHYYESCAAVFVWHTWVFRIWPVIKVEEENEDDEKFIPANPDCYSAPEIKIKVCEWRKKTQESFNEWNIAH